MNVADRGSRVKSAAFARPSASRCFNWQATAKLVYLVPFAAKAGMVEESKSAGTVRVHRSTRDLQTPDGMFAPARLEGAVPRGELIVAEYDGFATHVRQGLSYSALVLLTSVSWGVFALCVVLPWAVVGYVGYRSARHAFRPARGLHSVSAP